MNYDADDSADEIWCWWNEVHAVDSIKGQRKRRRARKWGTSHLSAADIGSREHGVEKKVIVNMKWKRKWKWTWSEKEIGFFCRYFVFSIGQMAKLSNDGPLRIGLIEYQEVDQSRPKDRSKKIFEKHKIKHIYR